MKILLGYSRYKASFDVKSWIEEWLLRLREAGIEVEPFCLTIDAPGPRLGWRELDDKWNYGDNKLYSLYEDLLETSKDYDVFINWNGINLHPDFVQMLPITKVYSCFDDPESSEDLSKPVAKAYDLCLVGNIAEVETYRQWGVKNVEFWPLGFFQSQCDVNITEEQILSSERDIDITLLCERVSHWRKERLQQFSDAFPQGRYYGRGWPLGFLDEKDKLPLYRRTKIGPNFHNSTGPINFRTFMLPANGIMLLCDNKSHLAKLYKLGDEAVGFDTIEEAIELCQYYLEHDDERKRIALAGWKRAHKDYNEISSFSIGLEHIKKLSLEGDEKVQGHTMVLHLRALHFVGMLKFATYGAMYIIIKKIYLKIIKGIKRK